MVMVTIAALKVFQVCSSLSVPLRKAAGSWLMYKEHCKVTNIYIYVYTFVCNLTMSPCTAVKGDQGNEWPSKPIRCRPTVSS